MGRRRRGYTLIEITVALLIGTLLATAAVRLMTATQRLFTRLRAHCLVQSGGQLGVGRLAEDLRLTAPGSLSIVTSGLTTSPDTLPIAISFCPQDVSGLAMAPVVSPQSAYVIYYYDSTASEWIRGLWTNTTTGATPPLSAAQLSSILTGGATGLSSSQVLTRDVVAATATPATWPPVNGNWTLADLQLQLTVTFNYQHEDGFHQIEGSFTETFATQASVRNGP